MEVADRILMISDVSASKFDFCKVAIFVWGSVVRWPECDRNLDRVGEFSFKVGELGKSERVLREPGVCGSVAPCNDCFSSRRRDWRRFDMMI